MGGAHFTFDATARHIEEVLATSKGLEMCVCTVVFGVFSICDWWRRIEDRSYQEATTNQALQVDGFLQQFHLVIKYKESNN